MSEPTDVMEPAVARAEAARAARRWSRRLAVLAVAVLLAGCHQWRPRAVPRPEATRYVHLARVTPEGGAAFEMREITVTADSLLGWRRGRSGDLEEVRLARVQVRRFEVTQFSPERTVLGAVLVVAAFFAAVAAVLMHTGYT